DGAHVESLATTTTLEQKVDISIVDRAYVDCTSTIDVTAKGYVGGWGLNQDGSNTRNDSAAGRIAGNTSTGGPFNSGATHGGLGAIGSGGGTSNAIYDSPSDPIALGGGGGGSS